MAEQRYELTLRGCTPIPLANYLKALGVLRLVAEQRDAHAQAWWQDDTLTLRSVLDREQLQDFFLNEYAPTPLVGPWGARSGFFAAASEKAAREALNQIFQSTDHRLAPFREAISAVRRVLKYVGMETKADSDEEKLQLMQACRSLLPDHLVPWLDATYVLLDNGRAFPPLLGTGGNEGSGSYMSGFAQQVVEVLIDRKWDHAIQNALFGENDAALYASQTPGHFSPEAAGGVNAGQGFQESVRTNPWDYLLLLEGTLLFASACVKKLEQREPGTLSFPFCVRPAGVGYGSASASDESVARAETWFPIWSRPSTYREVASLFSEGRATVNRRAARNAVDFARAIASFGVDRGIGRFERYGFHQRNGRSYFAVPLGTYDVRRHTQVDLVDEIDDWLGRFRRAATSKTAPARAGRALRRLEAAILGLCRRGDRLQVEEVLVALGDAEETLVASARWRKSAFLSPIPLLSPQWLVDTDDGSAEFRLAASLASLDDLRVGPFRRHIEPVEVRRSGWAAWAVWSKYEDDPARVWGAGDVARNLLAVLSRRIIEAVRAGADSDGSLPFPGRGAVYASLADVVAFIGGRVDDRRLESLIRGLVLVDWQRALREEVGRKLTKGEPEPVPDASYGLLKLCHLPHKVRGVSVPLTPTITQRACARDLPRATQLAARRLRGSGLRPAASVATSPRTSARRVAAAILFPISERDADRLAKRTLTAASKSAEQSAEP